MYHLKAIIHPPLPETSVLLTLCFCTSQHRVHLVAKSGVALVDHGFCIEPDGFSVGLYPTVISCSCAGTVCYLLVYAVGLCKEGKTNDENEKI